MRINQDFTAWNFWIWSDISHKYHVILCKYEVGLQVLCENNGCGVVLQ